MKARLTGAVTLIAIVVTLLALASPALAAKPTDVIADAKDGTIDKNWTAAQINAALAYLRDNPIATQYSDFEGVLEDYLQSLSAPGALGAEGAAGGQLAFTGGEIILILGAGASLIGGGVYLRRRDRS